MRIVLIFRPLFFLGAGSFRTGTFAFGMSFLRNFLNKYYKAYYPLQGRGQKFWAITNEGSRKQKAFQLRPNPTAAWQETLGALRHLNAETSFQSDRSRGQYDELAQPPFALGLPNQR
ncbi:hypothetical protein D3C81_1052800 [compost metagenome]